VLWLRVAALLTWVAAGAAQLPAALAQPDRLALAVPFYLGLGLGVFLYTRGEWPPRDSRPAWTLILLQYLCVLALGRLLGGETNYVFLVLVAGQLPWRLSLRYAVPLPVLASLLLYLLLDSGPGAPASWRELLGYLSFQAFALAVSHLAVSERRSREALAAANAELEATRALLAGTARQSERLRIARDLHDRVGHHLTALNLHLELASHLAPAQAKEPIAQAQAIGRALLHDVRAVVRDLREEAGIDLEDALRRLLRGAPRLETELRVARGVQVRDPMTADALLRVVQEALTNTLRHAQARRFEVALESADGVLHLRLRDDGRGLRGAPPGAGLRGMRERVEALGGELRLRDRPGLEIEVRLPHSEHA